MVLPEKLMVQFQKNLGFYSCTVPSFEQYTLARFLSRGYFEKHLNRMRKFYKARRNRVLSAIENSVWSQKLTILEENAGLHFLIKADTQLSDADLVAQCAAAGIRIRTLGDYCHEASQTDSHCLVVNYSGLTDGQLEQLETVLKTHF